MEQMVEPDRTILIVSIIGLVIIWGSVLYYKFVQGGGRAHGESGPPPADQGEAPPAGPDPGTEGGDRDRQARKKGKKRR